MDGIAIDSAAFHKGQRRFKIQEGVQAAGSPQLTLQSPDYCLEAMTGAIRPKDTDVVIQYELVEIADGYATVQTDKLKDSQNVHLKGLDRQAGALLIAPNTLISAAEIGVLATVGKSVVKVAKQPKVVIVSTGDELVDVTDTPDYYQIRRSNVFSLVALLEHLKIKADTRHLTDSKEALLHQIKELLSQYDVLLFSGGVSKGKFDYLPEVLAELGVTKLFHKVKQRPGKPFWFGTKGTTTIFAFPGNPVSTFASCLKYFYPWYQKSAGLDFRNPNQAVLAEDYYFKPDLTYFLQVKLSQMDGRVMATPVTGKGSADLANLINADAFIELPDDRSQFYKGEVFPLLKYRLF
jgi:molybdopterin molybdotransferase